MKLYDNWKAILCKAWSIRLMLVAGLFVGAEAVLPLFVDSLPRNVFAILSFISVTGAFVSRLIEQEGM